MAEEEKIVVTTKLRISLVDKIDKRAQAENRTRSNMIETMLEASA